MTMPAIVNKRVTPSLFFCLLFAICWSVAIYSHDYKWIGIPFLALLIRLILPLFFQPTIQLFWLICIAIPFSTELSITPALGIDFPDELLMMILTISIGIYLLLRPISLPPILFHSNLVTILLLGWFWTAITCMYSSEPLLSIKYLLAKVWFIVPFVVAPLLFIRTKKHWQIWAACLLVPMGLLVVQVVVRHGMYGFTFFSIRKAMAPFFRNHVNYAALLTLLLPVAVLCFYLTPRNTAWKKILLSGILLGIVAWVLAFSRGAWVALPAGAVMVFVVQKKWVAPLLVIGVAIALVSTAWLVTEKRYMRFAPNHDQTYFHTEFRKHWQATLEGKDISAAERWHRWVAGVRMLVQEPITGFGPNSFYRHYQPYTLRRFQTWVSNNPEQSTVHNYFLLLALEQGVIGLLLFIALIICMFLQLQQLSFKLQSRFYRAIAFTTSAILTILIVLNLVSDLIETDKVGSIFYSCLGSILLLQQALTSEQTDLA
jgi:O-antigen ligase